MKSNQKGFTLIELLAVIVILAIIALIATPIILNIVQKARKSAAEDSVYGVMKAIQLEYTTSMLNPTPLELDLTVTCSTANGCTYTDGATPTAQTGTITFSGTVPSAGTIVFDDEGKFTLTGLKVNGFECEIPDAKTQKVSCS